MSGIDGFVKTMTATKGSYCEGSGSSGKIFRIYSEIPSTDCANVSKTD